jgi:hypothetical protein
MLRSVEITALITGCSSTGENSHNLGWNRTIELGLDCFACERVGRTVELEWGAERAVCTSSKGPHHSAARVAAFDTTITEDTLSLRAIVEYWWAPFHDAEDDKPGLPLTSSPWVRLHLEYLCREPSLRLGDHSIQSNLIRPARVRCWHCEAVIGLNSTAPTIRLLV